MRTRVLVCGGRNFVDRDAVFAALDDAKSVYGDLIVIQGGATGVDALAVEWCNRQPSIHMVHEPADWKTHGRAAGPIRNQRMIDVHKPDVVIAFVGGRGTADMVRRAVVAGIPVIRKTNHANEHTRSVAPDRRADRAPR